MKKIPYSYEHFTNSRKFIAGQYHNTVVSPATEYVARAYNYGPTVTLQGLIQEAPRGANKRRYEALTRGAMRR